MSDTVICPTCKGRKFIYGGFMPGGSNDFRDLEFRKVPCPQCEGGGQVHLTQEAIRALAERIRELDGTLGDLCTMLNGLDDIEVDGEECNIPIFLKMTATELVDGLSDFGDLGITPNVFSVNRIDGDLWGV